VTRAGRAQGLSPELICKVPTAVKRKGKTPGGSGQMLLHWLKKKNNNNYTRKKTKWTNKMSQGPAR